MSKILVALGLLLNVSCLTHSNNLKSGEKENNFELVKAGIFCSDIPKEGCAGCYFGYRIKYTNNSTQPIKLFSSKFINECFESRTAPKIKLIAPRMRFKEINNYNGFKNRGMEMVIQNLFSDTIIQSGQIIHLLVGPKFKFGGSKDEKKERFERFINGRDSMSLEFKDLFEGQKTEIILNLGSLSN